MHLFTCTSKNSFLFSPFSLPQPNGMELIHHLKISLFNTTKHRSTSNIWVTSLLLVPSYFPLLCHMQEGASYAWDTFLILIFIFLLLRCRTLKCCFNQFVVKLYGQSHSDHTMNSYYACLFNGKSQ